LCVPTFLVQAQNGGTLPVASTVQVVGTVHPEGEVVVFLEGVQTYEVSSQSDQSGVFGVTAATPALVFLTATDTIPVVTEGVTSVLVSSLSAPVVRGDVLTTASEKGRVRVAGKDDLNVFAVALEDVSVSDGSVLVEVNAQKAQAVWKEKWQPKTLAAESMSGVETETDGEQKVSSQMVRTGIALALVLTALSFILYTFRATLSKAVVSIGRNPRARGSIMMLSFGNILFALLLCAVVLFVAVAVLVLPIA
jgi:hypothetical protein